MFKCLAQIGLALSLSGACFGATLCTPGTLASYITQGSTGCSIDNSVFANFAAPTGQNGATLLSPTAIGVTPITTPGMPGFTFTLNASASGGQLLESLISYQILNNPYTVAIESLIRPAATGDGAVTSTESLCSGGSFSADGVSGCTGSNAGVIIFQTATDSLLADSTQVAPGMPLSVTTDVTIDSGSNGTASLSAVTNQFATPEPSTLLLLASSTSGLFLLRRRKSQFQRLPAEERKD